MHARSNIAVLLAGILLAAAVEAAPQYDIFDLGVVQVTDTASQGFGVSPGGVAVGRSVRSGGAQAFSWTQGGGLIALPNLAGRNFAVSNDANDSGTVVGTAANSLFGTSRLPVMWQGGTVTQLPLPAGETLGDANGVNASNVAVGSVNSGITQKGVIYNAGSATVITQTTANNEYFVTAFGINNSGRIVGQGTDQGFVTTVAIVYDMGSPQAFLVGALPGQNGGIAFAVSNAGHVVGSSTFNGGSGVPFIWTQATGIVAVPLATGTSQGSARGVNSDGWVVGQDSSAFSIPFLWDGTTTYRLADLIPPGTGWDLSMNTSSSALGISDDGVIVGTGVHNGETHGYAMVPVAGASPTPSPSPSPTATPPAATPTPTATPAASPTPTETPSATPEPTASPTPAPSATPTPTSTPPAQAVNLSTRMRVQTGDNVGIGGFIITGIVPQAEINVPVGSAPIPKHVLIRAIGPSLTGLGVPGALADPVLELHGSGSFVTITNDNWHDDPAQAALIIASGIPPTNNAESAIDATLNPGSYTAVVRGKDNTTGVALVEIYDLDPAPALSKLANISTRAFDDTGDNIIIAGFMLGGSSGGDQVVLRGIGPSLTGLGVPNALANPNLELRNSNGALLRTNDNWQDDAAQAAVLTAAGLGLSNDLESGIAAILPPGPYTALLSGLNNGTGVGLVEVYDRGAP